MGYFANLELEVMEMAHDMGDDFGQDEGTILTISETLGVSPEEVQRILSSDSDADYDGQPDEMQEWHDFDPDC